MRKRIAAIHDLASFGGASLMNIIPIMYKYGIEVCPIPTSLFTSHGGFKGVKYKNNTDFIAEYYNQYISLNLHFEGLYLGLFNSLEQIKLTEGFLDHFNDTNTLIVLDPILGDNGKLYHFMDKNNVNALKTLICKSHIITPNLTEACLLLNKNYSENMSEEEIVVLLTKLSDMGPEHVIITSVHRDKLLYTYVYSKSQKSTTIFKRQKLEGSYPGTGDAFTSVLMAQILNGKDIKDAVNISTQVIEEGIKIILSKGYNPLEGLPLSEYLFTICAESPPSLGVGWIAFP